LTNEVRYVYDGNLVIQERGTNNMPLVSYTRGSDLSGSLQGAGGIGGLLARTDHHLSTINSPQSTSYYHADGNGNITLLINQSQATVAKYIYDAFGNIISQSGSLADANLYRFSSKEFHVASGLVYYLYRFYDPNLQRWLNRDPLGDDSFKKPRTIRSARGRMDRNLYWFVMNNAVRYWDYLGLDNPGCDAGTDLGCPSQKDCRLRACAQHDKCYHDNRCDEGSWGGTWLLNWLDGLITTPCQNCNNNAVSQFSQCALGAPSQGPRWFCPNGPSAGQFFDDYSKIPASCWEPSTPDPPPAPPFNLGPIFGN
jgi:RHS repeat-associated protein